MKQQINEATKLSMYDRMAPSFDLPRCIFSFGYNIFNCDNSPLVCDTVNSDYAKYGVKTIQPNKQTIVAIRRNTSGWYFVDGMLLLDHDDLCFCTAFTTGAYTKVPDMFTNIMAYLEEFEKRSSYDEE